MITFSSYIRLPYHITTIFNTYELQINSFFFYFNGLSAATRGSKCVR